MLTRRHLLLFAAAATAAPPLRAQSTFDHGYALWDGLVKKHVRWLADGVQSRVDYAGFQADRGALKKLLDAFSRVTRAEFDAFTRAQQMVFLVNAYNAFTVELILTKYPDLKSIKDLGSLFSSPWKNEFFTLLGERHHLDWIEHDMLRPRYKDPRVHAAVNCASIGCPALRDEAFVAERLDAQFDDGMRRFMSDRTRNRVRDGRLEVNAIFKWFRSDFEQGFRGWRDLKDALAAYATQLSDDPDVQRRVRNKALPVDFLDYDWSLNAAGR